MIKKKLGTLYVVATPIGNLQDITFRAVEILKTVDRIAVEDTRHAVKLLKHFSINKPTLSLHDFNEAMRTHQLIELIEKGESIALISDAGTPLISDPGFHLIHAIRERGIDLVPIPGACAAIAALSVAGLPTDKFVFEGFLPHTQEACRTQLISLLDETRTMIFYLSPHRMQMNLQLMQEVFGANKRAVLARELTKIHETIRLATLQALIASVNSHPEEVRGEMVLLLEGAQTAREKISIVPYQVLSILLAELPLKQAVKLASKITGKRKNELYEIALNEKDKGEAVD